MGISEIINEVILVLVIINIFVYLYNRLTVERQKNDIRANELDYKIKYDENEIIKHLDYIIDEALDEYMLQTPDNASAYISTKDEDKIIEYLQNTVPDRISRNLYKQLSYIYNQDYIGDYLGKKIYYRVVDFVIANNVRN